MKRLILALGIIGASAPAWAQSDPNDAPGTLPTDYGGPGAIAFVHQIFSIWSGPDPSALSALFADNVDYYGSIIPATKVQAENDRFTQRWQSRNYTVSSVGQVQCDAISNVCTVSGTIHWDDVAPGPKLHSVGDAIFSYSLQYDGNEYKITGEDGKVLDRTITPDIQPSPSPAIADNNPAQPQSAPTQSTLPETVSAAQPSSASASCQNDWHACKDDADLVNNYSGWADVRVACQDKVDAEVQYGDPKWPGFWSGGAFSSFIPGSDYISTGIAVAIEPDVQIQNEYGAMVHSTAYCRYDLNSQTVLGISVSPN
jgi:hypothetical protein